MFLVHKFVLVLSDQGSQAVACILEVALNLQLLHAYIYDKLEALDSTRKLY